MKKAQTPAPFNYFLMQVRSSQELFKTTWVIYRIWNANETSGIKKSAWGKAANS